MFLTAFGHSLTSMFLVGGPFAVVAFISCSLISEVPPETVPPCRLALGEGFATEVAPAGICGG